MKKNSIVSGKSVKDILAMDNRTFNRLTESELRKVVGRLVSAGNKRLRSFEKSRESSPATRYIEKSGGKFSTRGKDLNALRAEFARAKGFFESKTGSRLEWKKVQKETKKGLEKAGVDVDPENANKMWKAYERLKEVNPSVSDKRLKYLVLQEIADVLVDDPDLSIRKIVNRVNKSIDRIYEEQAAINDEFEGVSGFFEIE